MNDLDKLNVINVTLAQVGKTLNGVIYLALLTMTMTLLSTLVTLGVAYVYLLHLGVLQ